MVTVVVTLVGLARVAAAQPSAEAEALFRDARESLKDGKISEACEAFAASQQLEPLPTTLINLADCRERNGQLATAWALFLRVESETRDDPRKARINATARRRAEALESRLSYLTINVPDESRVPGLVVTRNGVVVPTAVWNRAVPVDGGEYAIEGKAPGHEPWSTIVVVQVTADHDAVEVPKFKELPKLVAPSLTGASKNVDVAEDELGPEDEPEPRASGSLLALTPRRKLALALGGGGAGVVVVGAVLGLRARSLQDDADAACPPTTCQPDDAARAERLNADARHSALYANIAFGVGAAAAVAGVVLYVRGAPPDGTAERVAVQPRLGPGFAGAEVRARF